MRRTFIQKSNFHNNYDDDGEILLFEIINISQKKIKNPAGIS